MRPPLPTHPEDDRLLELAYGEAPDAEALRLSYRSAGLKFDRVWTAEVFTAAKTS